MDPRPASSSSLLGSLREFVDGIIGSVHDRLDLLAVELHEEKYRLIQIFIWISSIVFLAMLTTVFVSLVLVVVFWETARIAVVCSLAGVYLAALAAVIVGFRNYLKRQPKPFAATLSELKKDRECIQPES
jgi:uncharacterized membrane protein YqjE